MLKRLALILVLISAVAVQADVVKMGSGAYGTTPVQSGGDSPEASLTNGLVAYYTLDESLGVRLDSHKSVFEPQVQTADGVATLTGMSTSAFTLIGWGIKTSWVANYPIISLYSTSLGDIVHGAYQGANYYNTVEYIGSSSNYHNGESQAFRNALGEIGQAGQFFAIVYEGGASPTFKRYFFHQSRTGPMYTTLTTGSIPSSITAPDRLYIGANPLSSPGSPFTFRNLGVYSRALSLSEIQTYFNSGGVQDYSDSSISKTGLVAFYSGKFSEMSVDRKTHYDKVGSANLVCTTAVTPVVRGLMFNNAVDTTPADTTRRWGRADVAPPSALTVHSWIYPITLPAPGNRVAAVAKASSATSYEYALRLYNNGSGVFVEASLSSDGTALTTATSTTPIYPNRWYATTLLWDGTTLSVAVNGTVEATQAFSSSLYNDGGYTNIGMLGDGTLPYYGYVDGIGLWSRKLDIEDVRFLSSTVAKWRDLSAAQKTGAFGYPDPPNHGYMYDAATESVAWAQPGGGSQPWNIEGREYYSTATSAKDLYNHTLTDNNTVLNSGGVGSYSLSLNGSTQSVDSASGLNLGTLTKATWSVWVYSPSLAVNDCVFDVRDATSGDSLSFYTNLGTATTSSLYVWDGVADTYGTTTNAFANNEWRHYFVEYDGTQATNADRAKLWINGVAQTVTTGGTYPTSLVLTNAQFALGWTTPHTAGYNWTGRIQNAAFWNSTGSTTAAEQYNSGRGLRYEQLSTAQKVNLVSFWTLGEGSSNRADSHGSNTLSPTAAPGRLAGAVNSATTGTAGNFVKANNEWLAILNQSALQSGGTDFTVAAWMNATSHAASFYSGIITKAVAGAPNTYEYDLYIEPPASGSNFVFDIYDGVTPGVGTVVGSAVSTESLTVGEWYFVVAWYDYDTSTVSIQVNNGTPVTASAGRHLSTTGQFQLGHWRASNTYPIDGTIDEVGVWRRTLTAAERSYLYNNGAGRTMSGGVIQ